MKLLNKYAALLSVSLLALVSCKDEPIVENPSGETIIYSLAIANGGISGAIRCEGTVNEEQKKISFKIPAETDIERIRFEGKLSLGANLDQESYNFLTGLSQTVRIINVDNSQDYTVTIELDAPTLTPYVDRVTITLSSGLDVDAFVSMNDKTIYFKTPNETSVTVKEIVTKPVRTQKTLTALVDGKLAKENPGKLQLDFMGLQDEYTFSFGNIAEIGADFTKGNTYDRSTNTTIYPNYSTADLRHAHFDGNHVLIVSRSGTATATPHLYTLADIAAGSISSPIALNVTGLAGGTYVTNAGRLSQGHIYICNLTTGVTGTPLKVYHWASPTAVPEEIINFNGVTESITGRFGDEMSVDLDESGDGYIFFGEQTPTTGGRICLRFKVTGFTTVSDPVSIPMPGEASYGMFMTYNAVSGKDNEYLLTSTASPIRLINKDMVQTYALTSTSMASAALDARIIVFNSARYLITTSGFSSQAGFRQTLYVYDITKGIDTTDALSNFEASTKTPLFTYNLGGGAATAPSANTGWGVVGDKLYLFASATQGGFAVFEFPAKE